MNFQSVERYLPGFLHRHILNFEARIEAAVKQFAAALAPGARVLDAGAGEGGHASFFSKQRYCGVDLAIGDASWDYRHLDAVADLAAIPFQAGCFDAAINIVTLEHVHEPAGALGEIARVLKPGGRLLLIVPQEWEVHQAPHDYYRFTRYGVRRLLEGAGFVDIHVLAAGGYFRLLSRRLLSGLQFFHGIWNVPAVLLLALPALLLPALDFLDRDRNFTLGYLCTATKRW
ncbi:MAG: class I SAM-dependent methyltransferase [Bryobacteraceae bacterium]|jgi:SAM-dependent methyltransferase